MPLTPGTRLGPYEITSSIGAGGMGEVYKPRDTRLARDVALKILPAEMANDLGRRQRFEIEARAVAALNHPNIVAIYDVGEGYIVSELVDGESLRRIKPGVRKTADIGVQMASGLAAAHEAGIVHRDLKPDNVLLTKDRHASETMKSGRPGARHRSGDWGGGVSTARCSSDICQPPLQTTCSASAPALSRHWRWARR